MNKKNFILSLFSFSFFIFQNPLFAQKPLPIWISDDFSKSNSGFTNEKGKEIDYEYKDGKYYIKNHSTGNAYSWTHKDIYTNQQKEIIFEANFSMQESGKEDDKHGFSLTAKDKKTYFFVIAPKKGTFQMRYYKGGFSDISTEKVFDFIKKNPKETNKLWVNITLEKVLVKINDKEVYSGANPKDFTATYGFFTSQAQLVEIDDFVFYQDIKINLVPNAPEKLEKINLGDKINTKYAETSPRITSDGKILYFCIHNSPENTGAEKDGGEIWYTESLDKGETWQPRKNIGKPLNNAEANFVISSTPDNNTMLVGNKYKADGTPNGNGISITHRTANGWEVPQPVDMEDFVSKSTNEFWLSNDRKTIIMSVSRDESIGGKDLFVSFNLGENKWSKPKSMGNVINTSGEEASPFLAGDGVSLYFSSNGHPGYGSNDIFVSKRLDDTWTKWSEPQNLGRGINSEAWEAYFTIPASGKYAYMTTTIGGLEGSLDIIRIKLSESVKPKPVVLISGKVFNSKTKEPMSANITYNALKANKELGIATSNPTDGSYKIVLPAGEFYGFLAQKNNFISVSENIDVTKVKEYQEITRDLYLSPIESGQIIRLNNVFFDFSKATLRSESFGDLGRLIQTLNDNTDIKIEIGGHTDNVGTADANQILSQNRAQSVVDYLASKGITKNRLIAKGYGMTKPTATNATDAGRQLNRRVEITILSK